MKKIWIFLIILIVLIAGFFVLAALGKNKSQSSITNQDNNQQDTEIKGVSFSPKSLEAADVASFFQKSSQTGKAITGGDEIEKLSQQSSLPNLLAKQASTYHYVPVILIGLKNIQDAETYKQQLVDFVKSNNIKYLGLGVEANRYSDIKQYESSYTILYNAVKSSSPETQIFPVFQYEEMKGLQGGLYGKTNDPSKAEWPLLSEIPSDMIGFTTYPGLIYKDPSEIPSDYYSEISQHTTKPIVFTEIGWFRNPEITGWESSEDEQAQFIKRYFELTKDLDVRLDIWSFLYDPQTSTLFKTMGLLSKDQDSSAALDAWASSN